MSLQKPADLRARGGDSAERARRIREDLETRLVELSEGKLRPGDIDSSANLVDYGYVDSLSAVSFLAHLEDRYGVQIDEVEVLEKYNTLDAIVERLLEAG